MVTAFCVSSGLLTPLTLVPPPPSAEPEGAGSYRSRSLALPESLDLLWNLSASLSPWRKGLPVRLVKYGADRAAPLQGADIGRQSGSEQRRVPSDDMYPTDCSSKESDRHGRGSLRPEVDEDPVLRQVVPEVGSRLTMGSSSFLYPANTAQLRSVRPDDAGGLLNSTSGAEQRGHDADFLCRGDVDAVEHDPWDKLMFSFMNPWKKPAERVVHSNIPAENKGFQQKSSQGRSGGNDRHVTMEAGGYGERRPDSPAVDVPVMHESRIERGIEAGWIEERRRDGRSSPSVPDWRFKGVVGAATRQPREEPEGDDMSDHLERMIDILEKSFANLDERLTAVENRSRRDVGGDSFIHYSFIKSNLSNRRITMTRYKIR